LILPGKLLLLSENACDKAKDEGEGLPGRIGVMDEEAVEVGEGGGDVRLVGRRWGVGEVRESEEEGQRRRKRWWWRRSHGTGSRCSRHAIVHGWLRVDNSAASVPRWCGGERWVRWRGKQKEGEGGRVLPLSARQCLGLKLGQRPKAKPTRHTQAFRTLHREPMHVWVNEEKIKKRTKRRGGKHARSRQATNEAGEGRREEVGTLFIDSFFVSKSYHLPEDPSTSPLSEPARFEALECLARLHWEGMSSPTLIRTLTFLGNLINDYRKAWRPAPDDHILVNPIYRVPIPSNY
jgi:hypothetical protein